MELWTDYEGRTIDGDYPLTKLIRPEGRSAFFLTTNGTGVPTVIRLIESHFDDEEILARWRGITALNHANLVKMKKYGQVTLDETSLVYAVMEPVEANLGEIVSERRLTALETKQIAGSLLAALEVLHTNGFVHEHVEPANVLAVGETIKLRSDCIREAPEGEEGRRLKEQDVYDFAVVVLQSLTQQKTLEGAARDLPLVAPFDEIVRKGISGEWGLAQISKALGPMAAPAPTPAPTPATVTAPKVAPRMVEPAAGPTTVSAGASASSAATSSNAAASRGIADAPRVMASASASSASSANRFRAPVEDEPAGLAGLGRGTGLKAVLGLLAVVIVFLAWHFLHGHSASQSSVPQTTSAPAPILDNGATTTAPPVVSAPAEEAPHNQPVRKNDVATPATGEWRVVAFTYNHEGQAQDKAAALGKAHPDLQMGVFTPTGHAPYLVTVGGPMSREEAFALSGKAKREGLPRDVYAQNYRSRER